MGGRALLVLLVSALLVQIRASDPVRALEISPSLFSFSVLLRTRFVTGYAGLQLLYESFDEDFKGRWVVSSKGDYQGIPAHRSPVSLFGSICATCQIRGF